MLCPKVGVVALFRALLVIRWDVIECDIVLVGFQEFLFYA